MYTYDYVVKSSLVSNNRCVDLNEESNKRLEDFMKRLEINKRFGRIILMLVFVDMRIFNITPIQYVQLLIEKEQLII